MTTGIEEGESWNVKHFFFVFLFCSSSATCTRRGILIVSIGTTLATARPGGEMEKKDGNWTNDRFPATGPNSSRVFRRRNGEKAETTVPAVVVGLSLSLSLYLRIEAVTFTTNLVNTMTTTILKTRRRCICRSVQTGSPHRLVRIPAVSEAYYTQARGLPVSAAAAAVKQKNIRTYSESVGGGVISGITVASLRGRKFHKTKKKKMF